MSSRRGRVTLPRLLPDVRTLGVRGESTLKVEGVEEQITFWRPEPLPPGLTIASDGAFTGEPTAHGLYTFTVTARGVISGATKTMFITVLIDPEDT